MIAQPGAVSQLEGCFDGIVGAEAWGWVLDRLNPGAPLLVEILDQGRVVGLGYAHHYRADIERAGIGSGRCAFKIPLPTSLWDGQPHELRARVQGDTDGAFGGAVTFNRLGGSGGVAELDGTCLVGTVPTEWASELPCEVIAWLDCEEVGRAHATPAFRIPLKPHIFDGMPHMLAVMRAGDGALVGHLATLLPVILTEERWMHVADAQPRAGLSRVAGFRYESLRRRAEQFSLGEICADFFQRVAAAHKMLVNGVGVMGRKLPMFEFPAVESPRASVVIPCHNKADVTARCLAALILAPNRSSFEVILVDDGSNDETARLEDWCKGVTVVRHEIAQGFVRSSNDGAALARGEYLVMLNNDTEVTAGWLDALLRPFERFESVGLTGAKLVYPDGRLQEAGGIVFSNGQPANYGRNGNACDPRYNYTRRADYLSGACVAIPRGVWAEVGGFNAEFEPAYYEDTDLAFTIRARGYETLYAPQCEVIHYEGVSSGTNLKAGMKRFQEVNAPKFRRRWAAVFASQGRRTDSWDLLKDRGVQRRALLVDAEVPQPQRDAGSYAAVQEIRLLQSLGYKVTFIAENLGHLGRHTEALQADGVEVLYAPYFMSVDDCLRARGREFDLVYVTRFSVAESCIAPVRAHAPDAKLVLNLADLHFLRELRSAIHGKDSDKLTAAVGIRDRELAVLRQVDIVLTYSQVEQAVIFSHALDSAKVARCPWVVELEQSPAPFASRAGIAFLGGFSHPPNLEAVKYFVREVLPGLRERVPGLTFHVYGSRVPPELQELEGNGLVVEGYVEEVQTVYQRHRLFVVPLQSGAGIKGKVIGAFAAGIPCVLSPVAIEGVPVREGLDALVARTAAQWIQEISRAYSDEKLWARLQENGQALAEAEYAFEVGQRVMRESLEAAGLFSVPDVSMLRFQRAARPA